MTDQPLELLCEDGVGMSFRPLRWHNGAWQSVETNSQIEATVMGWRLLIKKSTTYAILGLLFLAGRILERLI
jgi:hypothetical protein